MPAYRNVAHIDRRGSAAQHHPRRRRDFKVLSAALCGAFVTATLASDVRADSSSAGGPPPPESVSTTTPADWLPSDRGKPQYQYFDPTGLIPALPSPHILDALGLVKDLPALSIPSLDARQLLPQVPVQLPAIPELPPATSAIAALLGLAQQEVSSLMGTVRGMGSALGTAASTSGSAATGLTAAVMPAVNQGSPCGVVTDTVAVRVPPGGAHLAASGGPAGSTPTITPSFLLTSGTATLTQPLPCTAPAAVYQGNVSAVSGLSTVSAPYAVSVAPDVSAPQTVEFQLTTYDYANGVTQTFSIPLCTPTPVDAAGPGSVLPTTTVSLCPIPLSPTTQVMTPPPGQPAQLYLSVQQIIGTAGFPASFRASYTVPGTAPLTVTFGADSGSANNYPGTAVVGAATDYNPVTGGTAQHVTMSWMTSGYENAVSAAASGVGDVQIQQLPADSGSFAITTDNGEFNMQLANGSAWPGTTPTIVADAALQNTSSSARATWSQLPQDFTYSLKPTITNGQPTGFSFEGTQAPVANPSFTHELDVYTGGTLSGQYTQTDFGGSFSEDIETSRDQSGNLTGVDLKNNPGVPSSILLRDYQGGQLAAVLELGGASASASEVTVNLQGSASTASSGVTVGATNGPAFLGMDSYFTSLTSGSITSAAQASLSMLQAGATSASIAVPIAAGAQVALNANGVDPNFQMTIESPTSGSSSTGGAGTYELSGSTPDTTTAQQILIQGQLDPSHRVAVVMNSLGQAWDFKVTPKGTSSTNMGVDVADANSPASPSEYKEIQILDGSSGTYIPQGTFIIQRSGSNTSGAVPAGGAVATVMDPPATAFDITVSLSVTNVNGTCSINLDMEGQDPSAAPGSITLSGGGQTAQLVNDFVQGSWAVNVNGQGPSTTCTPDQVAISVNQGTGPNPSGVLTLQAPAVGVGGGEGQIQLSSFATASTLNITFSQAGGSPTGVQVSGGNSEANPTEGVQISLMQGGVTTMAFALSPGQATTPAATYAVTASYVPTAFNVGVQHTGGGTKDTVDINVANTAPQPNETINAVGPFSAAPGEQGTLLVRGFDTSSDVRFIYTAPNEVEIDSQNANPNYNEVIGAALLSGGTPQLTAVLNAANANLAGVPSGGVQGSLTWSPMPPTSFSLNVTPNIQGNLTSGVASGSLDVVISNAQEASTSALRLDDTADGIHFVINGTGSAQQFHIQFSRNDPASSADVETDGTVPAGFGGVQIYSTPGTFADVVFTIGTSGYSPAVSTNRGTDFWLGLDASQTAFEIHGTETGQAFSIDTSGGTQTSEFISVDQWYQSLTASEAYCYDSTGFYPCTILLMYQIPAKAQLNLVSPTPAALSGSVTYNSSTAAGYVELQSMVPGFNGNLQFASMPANYQMTYSISLSRGIVFRAYAGGAQMPNWFMNGYNIPLTYNATTSCTYNAANVGPLNIQITGTLSANLNYYASLSVQSKPGVSFVDIEPAFPACQENANGNNVWLGVEGMRVNGSGAFTMSWQPFWNGGSDSLHWFWSGLASSDQDNFSWTPSVGSVASLTAYEWQAAGNSPTGPKSTEVGGLGPCGPLQNINSDLFEPITTTGGPSVPFQPGFTEYTGGVTLCGPFRVAYFQLDPQNLLEQHCGGGTGGCPAYDPEHAVSGQYSVMFPCCGLGGQASDWVLADLMKQLYSADPNGLWNRFTPWS